MTLLICPFHHLYVHLLHEIFISKLLAFQVVTIEVAVVVVVNVAVTVELAVMYTYCVLVR